MRLLERHYAEEHFPIIALEMAKEVAAQIHSETTVERIPGEDDE